MLMARACYNPKESLKLWQNMQEASKEAHPARFLSTHPPHGERIEKLREWLPDAEFEYEKAGCMFKNTGKKKRSY